MAKTAAEKQAAYRERKKGKNMAIDKDSVTVEEEIKAMEASTELSAGVEDTEKLANLPIPDDPVGMNDPEWIRDVVVGCLGRLLTLIEEIRQHVIPPIVTPGQDVDGDFRKDRDGDYSKDMVPIDFAKCMKCGQLLPPTETPRFVQELCHDCVWRNSQNNVNQN